MNVTFLSMDKEMEFRINYGKIIIPMTVHKEEGHANNNWKIFGSIIKATYEGPF